MFLGERDGEMLWLSCVISGVLQGGPLSGSSFVIALDPLLYTFKHAIEDTSLGKVRACADDVGATPGFGAQFGSSMMLSHALNFCLASLQSLRSSTSFSLCV